MAERFPRGRSAIVGTATYGLGEAPGHTPMEMAATAGLLALENAGLRLGDVDHLSVCIPNDAMCGLGLAEHYGIHPRMINNNRPGGSAFMTHAIAAALAIDAGLCEVALITYASNPKTGGGRLTPPPPPVYEAPYGVSIFVPYALAATRHMHQYGTTRHQLAEVAVAARQWAALNPEACMREPMTIAQCLAARPVATPFTVRDCCLVVDGAGAVVMTSAARAKDLVRRPAYLLGGAEATTHYTIAQMADLTVTAAKDSGARAFAQAGLKPQDVDVLQLYDAFSINPILFLEDLGFCAKGEGGAFVEGGRIAPGGSLPVNTNGGGLSCVHPGMYGIFAMVEAARQIGGECGARQIDDVNVALAHGNGGFLSSQATLLFGSAATV